jgi:hypothetical protein
MEADEWWKAYFGWAAAFQFQHPYGLLYEKVLKAKGA